VEIAVLADDEQDSEEWMEVIRSKPVEYSIKYCSRVLGSVTADAELAVNLSPFTKSRL